MLSDKQKSLLALVKRSDRLDDGWYRVSEVIWPLFVDAPADLIELRKQDNDGGFLRLTPRGEAVSDYLV